MNYPQKVKINVAAASKRKHDLSHQHFTSLGFGRMKPIECRYLVPGDEFNYNLGSQFRCLSGLPSPTVGQIDVVFRSFFVPIYNVWQPFYDFLKNQPFLGDGGILDIYGAPYILLGELINKVISDTTLVTAVTSQSPSPSEFDFIVYKTDNQKHIYKWTKKGRIMNDFFTSFGINIPWGIDLRLSADINTKLYFVLPLVCFWKFYFDWIVPSRFVRNHENNINLFIQTLNNLGYQTGTSSKISIDVFFEYLVNEPLCYYLDDFFTTCTEYPFASENGLQDSVNINNPAVPDRYRVSGVTAPNVEAVSGGNPAGAYNDDATLRFNMFTLQTLGKLQDYLNRGLLAGTKVQDWLLSEFGIRPNDDALRISTYLGSKRYTLDIRDIISNADTEASGGVALGSYGGFIRSESNFDFGYKAKEHGFFFITCEVVPRTNYYQGLAAQFDMSDRFDFFQPEFDNQQGMPVPFRRLFFSQKSALDQTRFDTRFGFALQYADQKFAQDVISGDFRTRFGIELQSWYLMRDMNYIGSEEAAIDGVDEEFCLVKSAYQNWNYIFSDTSGERDPFLAFFYFKCSAMRPMKSITEGFEPTYKNSNKELDMDFSGSAK